MARSMLSAGMFTSLAFCMARRRRKLPVGSGPPSRADTVSSRATLVKSWPGRASTTAFLCLIPAHLLCPDIGPPGSNECSNSNSESGPVYRPSWMPSEALDRRRERDYDRVRNRYSDGGDHPSENRLAVIPGGPGERRADARTRRVAIWAQTV